MADGGQKPKRTKSGQFGRINTLGHEGWLGVLTGTELALWVAYFIHADAEGFAYPSNGYLADFLRMSSLGHLGTARRALEAYGLIRVHDTGGGRGKFCKIQMLVPPTAPPRLPMKHRKRHNGRDVSDAAAAGASGTAGVSKPPVNRDVSDRSRGGLDLSGNHGANIPDFGEEHPVIRKETPSVFGANPTNFRIETPPESVSKHPDFRNSLHREEQTKNRPEEQTKNSGGVGGGAADMDWLDPLRELEEIAAADYSAAPDEPAAAPADDEDRFSALVEDWMLVRIPATHRIPSFIRAFGEWLFHLRDMEVRTSTTAIQRQILELCRRTPEAAIEMIEFSIRSNWKSLHEPNKGKRHDRKRDAASRGEFSSSLPVSSRPIG